MDARPDANCLLRRYYRTSGLEAERALGELAYLCRGMASSALRRKCADREEAEELASDVVVRVVEALRRSRQPGETPLRDCVGYARTVAATVFADHLRAKRPALYRLKDRVLYVLDGRGEARRFARWRVGADWLGGLLRWRGRAFAATEQYLALLHDRALFCHAVLDAPDACHLALPDLLGRFFLWVATPVEVDELTGHMAVLQRVSDPTVLSLDQLAEEGDLDARTPTDVPSPETVVVEALATEEARGRVWREVTLLPPLQRAALLLGMERAEALLLAGSWGAANDALGLDAGDALAVWRALPMADGAVARRMGVTPKQVANLRKCARERLGRRLARDLAASECVADGSRAVRSASSA